MAKATTTTTTTTAAAATMGATVQATKGNTPGNNAHIITKVLPNPKRPGTAAHARYAAYSVGLTVAQAVQNGATREDIRWDSKRGHIVLEAPGK